MKRVCALTTVRNDQLFLSKWVDYYGRQLGRPNLYVILDGDDQASPADCTGTNIIELPHLPLARAPAMRLRAKRASETAARLLQRFDVALATDVDEFIVVDPRLGASLAEYLGNHEWVPSLSALGLDVVQRTAAERPLDFDRGFLEQRSYAFVSAMYTKASIIVQTLTWGSGWHRVKGQNLRIDPNLYLFHFGMADPFVAAQRAKDQAWTANGRANYFRRRMNLFRVMADSTPREADQYMPAARQMLTWWRLPYAVNKPAPIPWRPVVRIPERFRGIV